MVSYGEKFPMDQLTVETPRRPRRPCEMAYARMMMTGHNLNSKGNNDNAR